MTLTLHTSFFAWCNDWQLAEKTFAVFNVFICAVQLFFPGFFLRLPVTGIYSSDIMAAAAFSKMQNTKAVQNQATGHIYLSPFWRQGEQNAGSSFFPIFFVPIFTPDRGWSLSSSFCLDSCHCNWLPSPSSLRPIDSRVAAGQPIMKWPWCRVSEAIVPLNSDTPKWVIFYMGQHLFRQTVSSCW